MSDRDLESGARLAPPPLLDANCHQPQSPNDGSLGDCSNRIPDAILLRHHFPTASDVLEHAKKDAAAWDRWIKRSAALAPVLYDLWLELGRPVLKWTKLPGLPVSGSGECILQAWIDQNAISPNSEVTDAGPVTQSKPEGERPGVRVD